MSFTIGEDGILFPTLNLADVSVGPEQDGHIYKHNGNASINLIDGTSTSLEGYYSWDQETGTWIAVARNSQYINGYSEDELAKQSSFETHKQSSDEHHIRYDDDEARTAIDGAEVDIQGTAQSTQTDIDDHISSENPHNITSSLIGAIPTDEKGEIDGVASLDSNALIPKGQLPSIAITETHVVLDQQERLALDVEEGDIAIQEDERQTYIFTGGDPSLDENWEELESPTSDVATVFGRTGDVVAEQGDYSHGQLSNIGTDDHHIRYADSEAISAVDGSDINILGKAESTQTDIDNHISATNPHDITADTVDAIQSTDSNNLYVGETEPESPEENDIWIRLE